MKDFSFEIIQNIGIYSHLEKGQTSELNLVSFNGNEPKYDIRTWSEDHKRMGKGIRLTKEELLNLRDIIVEYFENEK